MPETVEGQAVILFDGVCNLCNRSVGFILQWERRPEFKFASIQSQAGQVLLRRCGLPPDYAEAVILLDRGMLYTGSTAALKIGQTLRFPWSALSCAAFIIPGWVRDRAYRQIAKHRYRWFGKRTVCMVPTEELRSRFYE